MITCRYNTFRWLALALLVGVAIDGWSQRRQRKMRETSRDSMAFVNAYMDSLDKCRNTEPMLVPKAKLSPLFLPLTFYHAQAGRRLDFVTEDEDWADVAADEYNHEKQVDMSVDNVLMHIYLKRPDLVVCNESQLRKAGTLRKEAEKPVKQKIELAEKAAPVPDEPQFIPSGLVLKKPNFWTFSGDNNIQFLQNYVTGNWYKGGESDYSMVASLILNANYNNKSKLKWDNKLELKLGFQTSRGDTLHKFKTNNDMIRYTGKVGIQAAKRWYYSLQLLAYTQFTQGLKSNDSHVYSDFMSPLNVNLGLGMDYSVETRNRRLTGSVNISLLSFNFRYVDRMNLASRYGIHTNHHTLEEFGSQITSYLTWKISDQLQWQMRFYTYTTYESVLMEWENTFSLSVSKYVKANVFLYPRFDDSTPYDDKLGYFQFKEYSSLGFTYSF